jgi:hypothetical protein
MLRKALLVFALGLLVLGLGAWLGGDSGAWPLMVWGAALLAAVLFERWRYRPPAGADPVQWQVTGERFVDPETGRQMQVLFNPRTGERRYQPAPAEDAPGP